MKGKLVLLLLSVISILAYAKDEIRGKVTKVIDGNTIEVSTADQEVYKVLLHGIDSPDPGQHFAEQAKKLLEQMLLNKSVTIQLRGKDRLGNRLGEISVTGAPDPRHELVKAGLAWTSEREPSPDLETMKEQARAQGKGLWGEDNPTPPWIFRRQQSMQQLKSS